MSVVQNSTVAVLEAACAGMTASAMPQAGPILCVEPQRTNATTSKRSRKRKRDKCPSGPGERTRWHTPWMDSLGMTEYESMEQRLHDEIVAFVSYCVSTEQEIRARSLVVSKVEELIKRRLASCVVDTFGSVALDLCLPDSDIDLVVQTPLIYDDKYRNRTLMQLSSMLKDASFCYGASVALGARVPVMQFEMLPTLGSFSIDVSINADDGVRGVAILKEYLTSLPPLRHLLLVLKGFLRSNGLDAASNGGLSSYALSCLVICFLKTELKRKPQAFIDHFMENESLGVLLLGFFHFYGIEIDWTTSCVVPVDGIIVTKESLGYVSDGFPDALSIECLVNPGRDIGRSASKATKIKNAFREAHRVLTNYTISMTNCNVLGSIINISQETSDRRERIRHLVDSGELEANLESLKLPAAWSPPLIRHDRHRGSNQSHSHTDGYFNSPAPTVGYSTYAGAYPGAGLAPYYWPSYPTDIQCRPTPNLYAPASKRQRTQ